MAVNIQMHEDRLFPSDPNIRAVARQLYKRVKDLPIISPHGHTDPVWYAKDIQFPNPTQLFIVPDHYIFRMLYSQGVGLEDLCIPQADDGRTRADPRDAWRLFADHYHLFRGTPSRYWLEHVFYHVFGIEERLCPENADFLYDNINVRLKSSDFSVRNLYARFGIEVISTTDTPLDDLSHHQSILDSGWDGRVIPAFRPDNVTDPEFEGFVDGVKRLGEITGEDTLTWYGYLNALMNRRAFFKKKGATSTDHGFPSARTANLSKSHCEKLLTKALEGECTAEEAELFRAQIITEMARMSLEDGLVMQIHPGSFRNHNQRLFKRFGRDKGADIPMRTDYVSALKPLLDEFGNEPELTIILFTLDETTYGRELAPLAGHYPILRLGPAWWFFDSPDGMMRFRRYTTETAGFYNTVGFNDDTRAFLSIPARHDMARRVDCAYLAQLVCEHRLDEDEAAELVVDLSYDLVKKAYKL